MLAPENPAYQKVLRLVQDGVSVRAAARAAKVPHSTAVNLIARSEIPFSGQPQPTSPNTPQPNWNADQPPPARLDYRAGYHNYTYQSHSAPLAFDYWTLQRVRAAVSMHRQGIFLESSLLALAILSFAPVFGALHQRLAPILSLPRHVNGGTRGLARIVREEVQAQLAPSSGLTSSPYFPTNLWGSTVFDLALMGFGVWQHVLGDPDEETGIRPLYTRRWPTWSTVYYRSRRTFQAQTDSGSVDILNDGKFTLIADSDEPHFLGAIIPLGEESIDGKSTQRARASWINKYGNPKWIAEMPPNQQTRGQEGDAAYTFLDTIRNPDGFGLVPHGMKVSLEGLNATASSALQDALTSNGLMVALVLLGTDGTMTSGSGGVYASPTYGKVAHNVVARDVKMIVRGGNLGHVRTYVEFNYADEIKETAGWKDPVLDIPLPDPEADVRIRSLGDRMKALAEQIKLERAAGIDMTQERVDQLAARFEVDAPLLAAVREAEGKGLVLAPAGVEKIALVDEGRASQGLKPIAEVLPGDTRGTIFIAEIGTQPLGTGEPGAAPDGAAPAAQETSGTGADPLAEQAAPEPAPAPDATEPAPEDPAP